MHVLVTGAAGSGTTTLGQALARRWNSRFLDADQYFWLPAPTPYSQRRAPQERSCLFLQGLREHPCSVTAGSVMGWGAEVEDAFGIVVSLYVHTEVRLRRLEQREVQRFGKADPAFLTWAAQYDSGPPEGRSLSKHNAWLHLRRCPVVRLNGDASVESLIAEVEHQAPNPSLHPKCYSGLRPLAHSGELKRWTASHQTPTTRSLARCYTSVSAVLYL